MKKLLTEIDVYRKKGALQAMADFQEEREGERDIKRQRASQTDANCADTD